MQEVSSPTCVRLCRCCSAAHRHSSTTLSSRPRSLPHSVSSAQRRPFLFFLLFFFLSLPSLPVCPIRTFIDLSKIRPRRRSACIATQQRSIKVCTAPYINPDAFLYSPAILELFVQHTPFDALSCSRVWKRGWRAGSPAAVCGRYKCALVDNVAAVGYAAALVQQSSHPPFFPALRSRFVTPSTLLLPL